MIFHYTHYYTCAYHEKITESSPTNLIIFLAWNQFLGFVYTT